MHVRGEITIREPEFHHLLISSHWARTRPPTHESLGTPWNRTHTMAVRRKRQEKWSLLRKKGSSSKAFKSLSKPVQRNIVRCKGESSLHFNFILLFHYDTYERTGADLFKSNYLIWPDERQVALFAPLMTDIMFKSYVPMEDFNMLTLIWKSDFAKIVRKQIKNVLPLIVSVNINILKINKDNSRRTWVSLTLLLFS